MLLLHISHFSPPCDCRPQGGVREKMRYNHGMLVAMEEPTGWIEESGKANNNRKF